MPDKLLTTAVVSYGDDNGLGIPTESFELFDFINVMTYDRPDHGSMEQFEKGPAYWSGRGLPKEKIVMGVPFYGAPDMPYFKLINGREREQFMASEEDFSEFLSFTIPKLHDSGATGAMLWCYADYIPELWDLPPCNNARNERFFSP